MESGDSTLFGVDRSLGGQFEEVDLDPGFFRYPW